MAEKLAGAYYRQTLPHSEQAVFSSEPFFFPYIDIVI